MSSETLKSFAQLHDDYAFFEQHASETQASLAAWLPLVQGRWTGVRALDFGAGSGSFTSMFLQRANFEPNNLRLTLVEPDAGFREQALAKLAPFSAHPIEAWPLLDRDIEPTFDLIFSHHVLYYVPNLQQTLGRLCGALAPGGRMLLVQGGQGNGLNQLVWAAFSHLGERPPYNYSEDTQAALRDLGVSPTVHQIHSVVDFPDSEDGRWRILRFLLSEHLAKLEDQVALGLFEPFVRGDRVHFQSTDELFLLDASAS
jgi:SAM-dependent methyltransferase